MDNKLDFLGILIGVFMFGSSLFSFTRSRIPVGLKGYSLILTGGKAKAVASGYMVGAVIISIASLLSWLNFWSISRYIYIGIAGVGVFLFFVFWLRGTIAAVAVESDEDRS